MLSLKQKLNQSSGNEHDPHLPSTVKHLFRGIFFSFFRDLVFMDILGAHYFRGIQKLE